MDVDFLLAHCPSLKLTQLALCDQQLVLSVTSTTPTALCPLCQTASCRIHCYYPRILQDLSWGDLTVRLQIRARRFVCSNSSCLRRSFAERLGEQIPSYAHRTKQCKGWLQAFGLALGGKAGARLAKIVKIPASPDTLLRLVRAVGTAEPERPPPQVLGIDDFALRKGEKYATILVDLERQHLVDLLPDREKGTVVAWLKAHPGV
jgi:transposase